jgi:hypothetical protein
MQAQFRVLIIKVGTAICVMPRPLRIEYAGAIYHVTHRGDRREMICVDETDRETFLRTSRL